MYKEKTKTKDKNKIKMVLFAVLTGALAGLINGLFGGGGGMVVVPMLSSLLKYQSKKAHATAILIILPLSIVSGILYFLFGSFEISSGIPVIIGAVVGGGLGAFLLSKLSAKWVVYIFCVLMAIAGGKMLFF